MQPSELPSASPVDTQRITFETSIVRTAFDNGAIAFQISPARQPAERVVCTVDETELRPCLLDDTHGRISFAGLVAGSHAIVVQIFRDTTVPIARGDHQLKVEQAQLVVFGATPAGVAAAIAAAQSGRSVVLIEPSRWVGGMLGGGLAKTDIGPRGHEVLGGLAAEFFRRVHAVQSEAGACPDGCDSPYDLEPHVAEGMFDTMLAQADVIVEREVELRGVRKEGSVIRAVATSRGELVAQVFIDASYEGDLMALAGVEYAVGREPRLLAPADDPAAVAQQEDFAGVDRYRVPAGPARADPFVIPGDPTSGTLSFIEPRPGSIPPEGDGDSRVMAYTYRLCVTDDPANRIPFSAPADYDPLRYEASARVALAWMQQGADLAIKMFNPARTVRSKDRSYYKYDLNGGSTFSIDMTAPTMNQAYVEGTAAERSRIRREYRDYASGLLYFWQTDPRMQGLNRKLARFGYCADEFVDRGNWPHQLYVREARRMRGEYVMNEADVLQNGRRPAIVDPIGFGYYDIDMHTHRYFAGLVDWPDGSRHEAIVAEGFRIVHLPDDRPYPVSYRALTPQARDATNFLNPVTLSATHVAYSSLRMEPAFMMFGEAAGVAASIAIENNSTVQAVSYNELRSRLLARGQRITN
jgi:hypothetical protein